MKNLKINAFNKIKIYKNDSLLIENSHKLSIDKLKIIYNLETNKNFFLENLKEYQLHLENLNLEGTFYVNHYSDSLEDRFNSSWDCATEMYITSLELINYNYITGRFILKYKYSMISFFIPFLIKNGKKLHALNNILGAISKIYSGLTHTNINNFDNYTHAHQFKHFIDSSEENCNINYLFNWIINIYKPVFDIKAFNVPKIHKKKSDKAILFKILYLSDKSRLKTAYKHISVVIKKDQAYKLENRILSVLLDMLLNYKKSYLYSRKMYIYEQVMEL